MKFQHPIFGKHDIGSVNGCVIFEPGAEGVKAAFILHQGEMDKGEIGTDLNAYLERLRKDRLLRESLGIPVFAYHAYMFSMPYDPKVIRRLFEYIRSGCYEVRIWRERVRLNDTLVKLLLKLSFQSVVAVIILPPHPST